MPLLFDHGEAPEIRLSQYFLQRSPFPALRPSTGPILERIEEGEEEYTELSNSIDTAPDEPKEENRDDDIFSELGDKTTDYEVETIPVEAVMDSSSTVAHSQVSGSSSRRRRRCRRRPEGRRPKLSKLAGVGRAGAQGDGLLKLTPLLTLALTIPADAHAHADARAEDHAAARADGHADARADNQEVAADGAAQGSSDDAPGSSDDGPHEVCAETAMLGPELASLTEKCDPRHGKYVACCLRYREDRSPTGLK